MDVCNSVQIVIVLTVLPMSSPVRTNVLIEGSQPQLVQNISSTPSDQHLNRKTRTEVPLKTSSLQEHSMTFKDKTHPTSDPLESNTNPADISKTQQLVQNFSSTSSDHHSRRKSRTKVPLKTSSLQEHSMTTYPTMDPSESNTTGISKTQLVQNFSSTSLDQHSNRKSRTEVPLKTKYPTSDPLESNTKPTQISKTQLVQNISSTTSDQHSNRIRSRTEVVILTSSWEDHPKTMAHPTSDPLESNTKPPVIPKIVQIIRETSLKPDPISNKSDLTKSSPKPLDLLSNKSQELSVVNFTSSKQANETSIRDANGTVVRRKSDPRILGYIDILYSKPPNRFYAHQVPTYAEGPTSPPTTVEIQTFKNDCDLYAYYCLKTYETGVLCARTLYFVYHTFPNYCMMDYTNCFFKANDWFVVHMGHCIDLPPRYGFYTFDFYDDSFLRRIRVREEKNELPIDLY